VGTVVFGDLTENVAGHPDEVPRGSPCVAVIRPLRGLVLEVALAVAGGGQPRPGPGRTQVGELSDRVSQALQQLGIVAAERSLILAPDVG
jgi:hypothetical protein